MVVCVDCHLRPRLASDVLVGPGRALLRTKDRILSWKSYMKSGWRLMLVEILSMFLEPSNAWAAYPRLSDSTKHESGGVCGEASATFPCLSVKNASRRGRVMYAKLHDPELRTPLVTLFKSYVSHDNILAVLSRNPIANHDQ